MQGINMKKTLNWRKIYSDRPSPVYFVYDSEDGILSKGTYGYGKIMYPEGSVYEGNLFYDGSFNKFGVGMQCFKNTKISQEEFGGPKGLLIDKFVGNFNHLETNWIYGDGILYFVDDNNQPKAFVKGFFRCLTKVDNYQSVFDESLLLPGYSLDMEVEQVLHRTRYEYLLEKVKAYHEVNTVLLGDSWFELYEMPYYKNGHIYGNFMEDTYGKSVLNLGIGGSTYFEWLNKVDELLSNVSFNNVIINLGFNDIRENVNLDLVFNNLLALETKIRKINSECNIYYLGVSPCLSAKFNKEKLAFNEMVSKYCSTKEKTNFVSSFEVFMDNTGFKKDFNKMFIENDGNHLNEYGYKLWSAIFKNIL
jgi:lysophospholipase L1-like esterase